MENEVKELIGNILNAGQKYKVIILAPTRDDAHFRIYCHGGIIGYIPNNKQGHYKLADEHYYWKFHEDKKINRKDSISQQDFQVLDDIKQNTKSSKQSKADIYLKGKYVGEYLQSICRAAFARWNGQERDIQNEIIFDSLKNSKPFIAIDMEYVIPVAKRNNSDNKNGSQKPEFDIVVISEKSKNESKENDNHKKIAGEIGFIELKSNFKACSNGKSGLIDHFNDMLCVFNKDNKEAESKEVVNRFNLLVEAGILKKQKYSETLNWDIFLGFIFIPDAKMDAKNAFRKDDVKALLKNMKFENEIENAPIDKNRIRFLWAQNPEEVDFSKMQTWDEFTKE